MSEDFLTTVSDALDLLNSQLGRDLEAYRRTVASVIMSVAEVMPLRPEHAQSWEVQEQMRLVFECQKALVAGTASDCDTMLYEYRQLLDMVSIHNDKTRADDDTVLSFSLTDLPRMKTVRDESGMTRGDLATAAQAVELDTVMMVSESEIVGIAVRRDKHGSDDDEDEEEEAAEAVKTPTTKKVATDRYVVPIYDERLQPRAAIAAAHFSLSAADPVPVPTPTTLPILRNILQPLLNQPTFTAAALARTYQIVEKDDALRQRRRVYRVFVSDIDNRVHMVQSPLATGPPGNKSRELDGNDEDSVVKKTALALHGLHWIVRMIYLASMAGSIQLFVASAYSYETVAWSGIKTRISALATSLDRSTGTIVLANLFDQLARFGSAPGGQAGIWAALERSKTSFFANESLYTTAGLTALSGTSDKKLGFYVHLTLASGAALSCIGRFLARCASLVAISGALASPASSLSAAGERRGINSLVFSDTLHASLDVDAAQAFEFAVPLLLAQSAILRT
jgi:hypothetical protein